MKKILCLVLAMIFVISLVQLVSAGKEDKLQEFKDKVQEAKGKYQEAKQEFLNKSQEAKEAAKEKFLQFAKEKLSSQIGLMTTILERSEARFEQEGMEDAVATIKDAEDKLSDLKSKIEGDENISKESLKEYLSQAREIWKEAKEDVESGYAQVWDNRLGNILVKLENLQTKFNGLETKLSGKGYDTSKLEGYMGEFKSKLESANSSYSEAKELFEKAHSAASAAEKHDLIKQAHDKQRDALQTIKGIREDLRNIVDEIKDAGKQLKEGNKTQENSENESSEE